MNRRIRKTNALIVIILRIVLGPGRLGCELGNVVQVINMGRVLTVFILCVLSN